MKSRAPPRIPPLSSADAGRPAASPKYRQDNRSRAETDALITGIRKMITTAAQTASKDDCITMVITACIEQGFDIGPRITGIARSLGYNVQHIGIILNRGTGNVPGQHRWYKDQQGRYRLP